MLINGTSTDGLGSSSIIEELRMLPKGVERKKDYPPSIVDNMAATQLYYDGRAAEIRWGITNKPEDLDHAVQCYTSSAIMAKQSQNFNSAAYTYGYLASLCFDSGRIEAGIAAYEDAMTINKTIGDTAALALNIVNFYQKLLEAIHLKKTAGLTEEASALQVKLRPLRQLAMSIFSRMNGESENPAAYCVAQGEVGFSSSQPIGTDNINDCVCVMIRDPETGKVALGHVDAYAESDSLTPLMSRMQNPHRTPPAAPFEVRLIGARYYYNKDYIGDTCKKNVATVIKFLKNYHVNILSADLFNLDQPKSVVVDPITFHVTEETPRLNDPNAILGNALALLPSYDDPLHVAFDLKSSTHRAPIILREAEVAWLRENFLGKTEDELYAHFRANNHSIELQLMSLVEWAMIITEAYEHTFNGLIATLDAKIGALGKRGVVISAEDRAAAVNILGEHPIHLGENCEIANQPLVDFIETKLFTRGEGATYTADIEGLKAVQFAEQPYDVIEAAFQQKQAAGVGTQANPVQLSQANAGLRSPKPSRREPTTPRPAIEPKVLDQGGCARS